VDTNSTISFTTFTLTEGLTDPSAVAYEDISGQLIISTSVGTAIQVKISPLPNDSTPPIQTIVERIGKIVPIAFVDSQTNFAYLASNTAVGKPTDPTNPTLFKLSVTRNSFDFFNYFFSLFTNQLPKQRKL
jgi:hypothetical protein